jgi:RNA polymerase sigma-70 factor (ECF subfamily)
LRIAQAGRRSRDRRERAASPDVESAVAAGDDPAEQLATRRSLDRVQQALEGLSLEQRAAFVLFEIEGESCESIANVLCVPVGTVYSRLHHARQRFTQLHQALLNAVERTHRSQGSTR